MTRALSFTVVGLPATKGSGRAVISNSTGKAFYKPDNPRTKGWQQTIANAAALELQREANAELRFEQGPIALECCFYLPRPQALLTKRNAPIDHPHVKKPDLDKLTRACKDALTRVVWTDDSQVIDLVARKRYCAAGAFPRVEITVRHAALEGQLL